MEQCLISDAGRILWGKGGWGRCSAVVWVWTGASVHVWCHHNPHQILLVKCGKGEGSEESPDLLHELHFQFREPLVVCKDLN